MACHRTAIPNIMAMMLNSRRSCMAPSKGRKRSKKRVAKQSKTMPKKHTIENQLASRLIARRSNISSKGASSTTPKPSPAPKTPPKPSIVSPSRALQGEQTPQSALVPKSVGRDLTNLPDELDAKYLEIDPEGTLRPTIIKMDPDRKCTMVSCRRWGGGCCCFSCQICSCSQV